MGIVRKMYIIIAYMLVYIKVLHLLVGNHCNSWYVAVTLQRYIVIDSRQWKGGDYARI